MSSTAPVVGRATTYQIVWGIVLMILGVLAIAVPYAAAVAAATLFAWLLVIGGIVHLVYAFETRGARSVLWHVLIGVLYIIGGVYLMFNPVLTVASLTLVLAAIFLVEGILEIIAYFQARRIGGSMWLLLDGIVTVILAFLIYAGWPNNSLWVLGFLVGISL